MDLLAKISLRLVASAQRSSLDPAALVNQRIQTVRQRGVGAGVRQLGAAPTGAHQRLRGSPARRAKDNSPAIYRWGSGAERGNKSRQGRKNMGVPLGNEFFRPSGACAALLAFDPSDESLGYSQPSLTGLATARRRGGRFVLLAMHLTLVERGFPSPAGRKTIARRFIAGVRGERGQVPSGTKEHLEFHRAISFAPAGAFDLLRT